MSSELTVCIHCDGWGCRRCTRLAGEQGLDIDEQREIRMRDRIAELEAQLVVVRGHLDDSTRDRAELVTRVDELNIRLGKALEVSTLIRAQQQVGVETLGERKGETK